MRYLILILGCLSFASLGAQVDSLLSLALWEEPATGYVLRLSPKGNFDEDRGAGRYLQGRWEVDSAGTELLLAVDGLLGGRLVHRRYRRDRDFYLEYRILVVNSEELLLEDLLTGEERHFFFRELGDYLNPSERLLRTAPQPKLELPKSGGW